MDDEDASLLVLADAALQHRQEAVSPVVAPALVLPKAVRRKAPPKRLLHSLPDNLTSPDTIRAMTLKGLEKVHKIAG